MGPKAARTLAALLVQLTVAAGAFGMLGSLFSSTFRPRELFNGTVRQLADHLENIDVSDADQLTIHRVAVVRPLEGKELLTSPRGSSSPALASWAEVMAPPLDKLCPCP